MPRRHRHLEPLAAAFLLGFTAVAAGCRSSDESAPASQVTSITALVEATSAASCGSDAREVAIAFVVSVMSDDSAGIERCSSSDIRPSDDRLRTLRSWGELRFEEAEVGETVNGAVTVQIPSPPIPNVAEGGGSTIHMPDHATGILVQLVGGEATGYLVSDVTFYASS
jgi:hypothetical protein